MDFPDKWWNIDKELFMHANYASYWLIVPNNGQAHNSKSNTNIMHAVLSRHYQLFPQQHNSGGFSKNWYPTA